MPVWWDPHQCRACPYLWTGASARCAKEQYMMTKTRKRERERERKSERVSVRETDREREKERERERET